MALVKVGPLGMFPTRGSTESAGWDLYAAQGVVIPAGGQGVVGTDIYMSIQGGYYGRIAPRSGLALQFGIDVGGGVIDSDYRGEIKVILFNHGHETVELAKGARIAQIIFTMYNRDLITRVTELPLSVRGAEGFGSTGV